jgi:CBS domain-containing membrane protein
MKHTTSIAVLMTQKPLTVAPKDSLEAVRLLFETKGFHHVPVVENNILKGIVSYTDYLRIIKDIYAHQETNTLNQSGLNKVLVEEVMTTNPICLSPTDTVEDALRIFRTHAFHAIPVVESNQKLVGILSTHDLVKLLEQIIGRDM